MFSTKGSPFSRSFSSSVPKLSFRFNQLVKGVTPIDLFRSGVGNGAQGQPFPKYGLRTFLDKTNRPRDLHEASNDPFILYKYEFGGASVWADIVSTSKSIWKLPRLTKLPSEIGLVWSPDQTPYPPPFAEVRPSEISISESQAQFEMKTLHSFHFLLVPAIENLSYETFIEILRKLPWEFYGFGTLVPPPNHVAAGIPGIIMAALYTWIEKNKQLDDIEFLDHVYRYTWQIYNQHLESAHQLKHVFIPRKRFDITPGIKIVLDEFAGELNQQLEDNDADYHRILMGIMKSGYFEV